jgi:hypothetical protein
VVAPVQGDNSISVQRCIVVAHIIICKEPFGRLGSQRGLDGLFESGRQGLPNRIATPEAHFNAARIALAEPTLLADNFSRAMRRKPRNRYNVSQFDSSLWKEFARYPSVPGGTVPSLRWRVSMRIVVSLLTAVCFIAAAEASATGVATPQSQAALSAPKPSTIDIIRQPSLLRQKLAGNNCQTTCQWIGGRQFCNTYCF